MYVEERTDERRMSVDARGELLELNETEKRTVFDSRENVVGILSHNPSECAPHHTDTTTRTAPQYELQPQRG